MGDGVIDQETEELKRHQCETLAELLTMDRVVEIDISRCHYSLSTLLRHWNMSLERERTQEDRANEKESETERTWIGETLRAPD